METRRECWFLGTWVSRRSVDSESENWPRRPGRDWLHGRPPSTPWPSSLAVVQWQVRKRFVWVHRFVLCGGLVLSAVSEGRCGPGPRLPRQPRYAPAPFLTIVGNRPRPWPMRTPSPVRLSDVGASSPSRLLSLWPSEQNVLQASLQRTVPRGSPRAHPPSPAPTSSPHPPCALQLPRTVPGGVRCSSRSPSWCARPLP